MQVNDFRFLNGLNILLIDDNLDFLINTRNLLEELFNSVHIATNGEEAFLLYQKFTNKNLDYFDLVITDIKMPIMDGIIFSKKIKELNNKQLIVFLTAYNISDVIYEVLSTKITCYINKPLTELELIKLNKIVSTTLNKD